MKHKYRCHNNCNHSHLMSDNTGNSQLFVQLCLSLPHPLCLLVPTTIQLKSVHRWKTVQVIKQATKNKSHKLSYNCQIKRKYCVKSFKNNIYILKSYWLYLHCTFVYLNTTLSVAAKHWPVVEPNCRAL